MSKPALILASRSPRRVQLLREAGYALIQLDPPFADPPQPDPGMGEATQVTLDLARRKAHSLIESPMLDPFRGGVRGDIRGGGAVVLAADTVCVGSDDHLLGQPESRESARTMIRSFLGRSHRVVSAVCLIRTGRMDEEIGFADVATVTMGEISDAELELYLDTQQWRGKAGGYNLFDRREAGWPIHVEGDPATVMGLPMRWLNVELKKLSILPTLSGEERRSQSETIQA